MNEAPALLGTITALVQDRSGVAIVGVTVTATPTSITGSSGSAETGTDGKASISVSADGYNVSCSKSGCTFSPTSQPATVKAGKTTALGQTFIGTCS